MRAGEPLRTMGATQVEKQHEAARPEAFQVMAWGIEAPHGVVPGQVFSKQFGDVRLRFRVDRLPGRGGLVAVLLEG